jgi:AraC-like DNA-binding protein
MPTKQPFTHLLPEPEDYFTGFGGESPPVPENVLLFSRLSRETLQQNALENKSHHRFVLIFNVETEGYVHLDHLSLKVTPGQALLIHPYQFHFFSHLRHSKLDWLFCTFELHAPEFLEPLRSQVIELDAETAGLRDALLLHYSTHLVRSPRRVLQEQLLQVQLLQVLIRLKVLEPCRVEMTAAGRAGTLLPRVNQLIAQTKGSISLAEVAESSGFSESRFRVLFKQESGVTIGRYIQNYRLTRAMYLLRKTDHAIAEVAAMAGLGSPEVFSRFFRQRTGQSPRAFRKKLPDLPTLPR